MIEVLAVFFFWMNGKQEKRRVVSVTKKSPAPFLFDFSLDENFQNNEILHSTHSICGHVVDKILYSNFLSLHHFKIYRLPRDSRRLKRPPDQWSDIRHLFAESTFYIERLDIISFFMSYDLEAHSELPHAAVTMKNTKKKVTSCVEGRILYSSWKIRRIYSPRNVYHR